MTAFEEQKIDGKLRRFFQSELPHPWPEFAYPQPAARPARNRQRWLSRLALAACVALVFLGYWSLTLVFPTPTAPEAGGVIQQRMIGSRPHVQKTTPTPIEKVDGSGKIEKILPPGGSSF